MVKVWKDAGELVKNNHFKVNRKIQDLMQEIPNFNKREDKEAGANKIYEKAEYIVLRVSNGFIAYNTKKTFDKGHTHLYSFEMAKTIVDNCIRKKKPKTSSVYLLNSHIRISKDDKYINFIEELITAKKANKKPKYINSNNKNIR